MNHLLDLETLELKSQLLGSLLLFTRLFFEVRTGKPFVMSQPDGNESHFITICRELTAAFYLNHRRLLINCPPGWSKSELCKHFMAWAYAHYPDCNFLYISYSHELAAGHTHDVKKIIELPLYKKLFGVTINKDSSAKDHFMTMAGGEVRAFGSSGSITGCNAGLPGQDRFSGAVIMDDMHKPDEVHSETIRETVKRNYHQTIDRRPRAPNVPIIGIGQRLHEDDLFGNLGPDFDGYDWKKVIICGLDKVGNAVYPEVSPKEQLLMIQKKQPYVYASQYDQNPLPASGGIFNRDWFYLLDNDPKILTTFITADTAETDKNYNDATVFSFWGIYKIEQHQVELDLYGVHWLDCLELRIEPKDLENEFLNFYAACMRYPVKPLYAAIEKKSTGVTLSSTLQKVRGLNIIDIERTRASGNKTSRYLEIQPYVSGGQVSLTKNARHLELCLEHCRKITANNTHRHDDIADTLYDAVKLALIDNAIPSTINSQVMYMEKAHKTTSRFKQILQAKSIPYGSI